jgi:protein-S-isoprenylcysteine O-methyltransferase Ste14
MLRAHPRALLRAATLVYAVVAHLAATSGFAYLLAFLLDVRVPRTVERGGPTASLGAALAIDVALLAAFAVPHSVLARAWWKRAWRRVVPEALDRSTYGLVAAASLGLLFWQWRPVPRLLWDARGVAALALQGAFWAGWALCAVSVLSTNLFDLTGVRQALAWVRGRRASPVALTRRGLYAHARHPLYVGFLLALWGAPRMSVGRLVFALGCTAYILVAVGFEERDLRAAHGPDYDAYRAAVPRFGVALPWRRAPRSDAGTPTG